MKYKNAPISEVIIGITLKKPINNSVDLLSFYHKKLSKEYPLFELANPLGEFIIFDTGRIQTNLDIQNTGQALFRFRSKDKKYLIQLQNNKIYLNWIRTDSETVGNYTGFSNLFEIYNDILSSFMNECKFDPENFGSFDLTYHDRFDLDSFLNDGFTLEDIINLKFINYGDQLYNFSYQITENIEKIKSFSKTILETVFNDKKRMIRFEHIIQSIDQPEKNIDEWFKVAHELQLKSFEETFSKEVLEKMAIAVANISNIDNEIDNFIGIVPSFFEEKHQRPIFPKKDISDFYNDNNSINRITTKFSVIETDYKKKYFSCLIQNRIRYLKSLSNLPDNWIDGEALIPSSEIISQSTKLLKNIEIYILSAKQYNDVKLVMSPTPEGLISIVIKNGEDYISSLIDKDFYYLELYKNDNYIELGEVDFLDNYQIFHYLDKLF